MNNENHHQPEKQTETGVGVVVAGPMARSLANGGDAAAEDAHWKTNYSNQEYVDRDAPYATYQAAYGTGYEGRIRCPGKMFEEVETELQQDCEKTRGHSTLSWDKAKRAARDAWNRVDMALSGDADADGR